jgi:putative endonuclease
MSEFLSVLDHDIPAAHDARKDLGAAGEAMAADFLTRNGYRLVMANFKVPIGRNSKGVQVTGEIDIVALDGETLCFIEVKARRSAEFVPIETNVDRRKRRQISRTARVYRRIFKVYEMDHRYDVVTVLMADETPIITLNKNYWTDSSFRKARWNDGLYGDFV